MRLITTVLLVILIAVCVLNCADALPKRSRNRNRNRNEESDNSRTTPRPDDRRESESGGDDGDDDGELAVKETEDEDEEESDEDEDEDGDLETTTSSSDAATGGKGKRGNKGSKKKKNKKKQKGARKERKSLKKSRAKNFDKPPKRKAVDKQKRNKMKKACKRKNGGCKGQSKEGRERKAAVKDQLSDVMKKRQRKRKGNQELTNTEIEEIETKTARRLDKTQDAKKALYQAFNLTEDDIEPDDNGVWQEDMILSEEQAEAIVVKMQSDDFDEVPVLPGEFELDVDLFSNPDDLDDSNEDTKRRAKRFAIFLEQNPGARWDKMPIPVLLEETFTDEQKAMIQSALADFEQKTCIKFEILSDFPDAGVSFIFYVKESFAAFCGLSSVGRQQDEAYIWLNFEAGCAKQINGTIIHETMHALGVDHHHIRYDRNSHLNVDFDVINPQAYDLFAEGDSNSFTSYGIPFDVYSVMNYNAYSGVISPGAKSMTAVKEPSNFFTEVLGQRVGMSGGDAELLRRMYCSPDCEDYVVYCGWWSTVGYCDSNVQTMLEYCPKSCNFCPNSVNDAAQAKLKAAAAAAEALLR